MRVLALALCGCALPARGADVLPPGTHELVLEERSAIVHVPAADGPLPVLLCFHGGGSNAEAMRELTGLDELADREGLVVVYPRGTGRFDRLATWNAGECCGWAMEHEVDDVGFVGALLDELERRLPVDRRRIHATGLSNGAMLSYRLANELSTRIASIAPVGGPMGQAGCAPTRPVSVLHFHGSHDAFAPFEGGPTQKGFSPTDFRSVAASLEAWRAANGCAEEPWTEELADTADDGCTVERTTWTGDQGSEVVLVKVIGGGHTWPGRPMKVDFLGATTLDVSANELMWEFFRRHPLPEEG